MLYPIQRIPYFISAKNMQLNLQKQICPKDDMWRVLEKNLSLIFTEVDILCVVISNLQRTHTAIFIILAAVQFYRNLRSKVEKKNQNLSARLKRFKFEKDRIAYVQKNRNRNNALKDPLTVFAACILIAKKSVYDECESNALFAKVWGVRLSDLNFTEVHALETLSYDVIIDKMFLKKAFADISGDFIFEISSPPRYISSVPEKYTCLAGTILRGFMCRKN